METGFIYDDAFLRHDTGPGHPECPARLQATMAHLQSLDWFSNLHPLETRLIETEQLLPVHASDYIRRAEETCLNGGVFLDSMDVGVCRDSYEISLLAAGATLVMADEILKGRIDNGFILTRPPGHHAERSEAMGFCLFNNVAVLARYLQKQHGLDKILILDWDVHHGNGTQHIFEDDPSVFYISTHEYPYYPGTGAYSETGIGSGRGTTLNCPMPAGVGDTEYQLAFREKILPAIAAYAPEFVIVSAGFDAHLEDPLGHICLNTSFYRWMTDRVVEVAEQHCRGRIISVLEGGYNLRALPLCIAEHLQGLMQPA